jgi:signal transduction histidine kinase
MQQVILNNRILKILAVLFLTTVLFNLLIRYTHHHSEEEIVERFSTNLNTSNENLFEGISEMESLLESNSILELHQQKLLSIESFENAPIQYLLTNNDQLVFWTSNKLPINELKDSKNGLVKTAVGWYVVQSKEIEQGRLIGTYLVKQVYANENTYLQSGFSKPFELSKYSKIIEVPANQSNFKFNQKYYQLNVHATDMDPLSDWWWLDVLGLIFLFSILYFLLPKLHRSIHFILAFLGLLVLRWVMYSDLVLPLWETTFIFDPSLYATNDWTTSIGDLLLHGVYLMLVFRLFKQWFTSNKNIFTYSILATTLLVSYFVLYIVTQSVVEDGNIPLDLGDILSLDGSTIIILSGIFVIGYAILYELNNVIIRFAFSSSVYLKAFIVVVLITSLLFLFFGIHEVLPFGILIANLFLFIYIKQIRKGTWTGPYLIVVTALFAFLINNTIQKGVIEKQENYHYQLLQKEMNERDPLSEFLIVDMLRQISKDKEVSSRWSHDELSKYLSTKYISNLPTNFEVALKKCNVGGWGRPGCLPELSTSSLINKGSEYRLFYDMIRGKNSYLAEVNIDGVPVFISLRTFENQLSYGFPVLLVDKEFEQDYALMQKSFAKYNGGMLVESRGDFPYRYHLDQEWRKLVGDDIIYVEEGEYKHAIVRKYDSTYVISQPIRSLKVNLAGYSYFFTFGIITLIIAYGMKRLFEGKQLIDHALKTRFQTAMLLMLLFSTIVIGAGSIYYQKSQFNQKSFEAIAEKIKSVNVSLSNTDLGKKYIESIESEQLNELLKVLANTYYTDINIYDLSGKLYASSQKRIFESGILSKHIQPTAFKELFLNQKSQFVQVEQIGELTYLSAYVPLINKHNQLTAFINLPYFAKTSEFEHEISNLLLALINIYALLILLSLFLGYLVSNRITQPLEIIQESMAALRIGNHQKAIDWDADDEIGRLVKQYNLMVEKLEESAQQLALKEREVAWREMAQQVAHEIKNPLTPMKLNIQHFQAIWDRMTEEERKKKFSSMSKGLIEQIETLNAIATEFSSFAKLPKGEKVPVVVFDVLKNVFELFNKYESIDFSLEAKDEDVMVLADKEQMNRVFTNILQNAIQAIPNDKKGRVDVKFFVHDKHAVISFSDNGDGIPQEIQSKIFTPNFTTKSTGTGLGLAMTKQIIEYHQGEISFETKRSEGTVFIVRIPIKK